MDLEKAYNKIDNLCCLNNIVMQTIKTYLEHNLKLDPKEIDFFKAYKETKDDDFCKDVNEMVEALETIKGLVDLQKEIGCPLEVRCKVLPNSYIFTFGTSYMNTQDIITRRKVINISKEGIYISYTTISGKERDMLLSWKSYKKTWWLKEDKGE